MRWFTRAVFILASLTVSALVASLLVSQYGWGRSSHQLMNVGGSANSCHCTQRIER